MIREREITPRRAGRPSHESARIRTGRGLANRKRERDRDWDGAKSRDWPKETLGVNEASTSEL